MTPRIALECFQLILFDQRPLFRVTDFAQRLPCTHVVWNCRSERSWNEQKRYEASDNQASRFDHFASNIQILSLYADERAILDQVRSSRRLSALLRPELRSLYKNKTSTPIEIVCYPLESLQMILHTWTKGLKTPSHLHISHAMLAIIPCTTQLCTSFLY